MKGGSDMFNIELDISGMDQKVVKYLELCGINHGYEVFNHGVDRLVFNSERFNGFTQLVNELSMICQVHGFDYASRLV